MTTTEPAAAQALSTRTVETYRQDWALFTDWCAATGNRELPADPDTILRFLSDCPATRATHRCRVAAIDHHHAGTGLSRPGESTAVRAALGRPVPAAEPAPPAMTDEVAAALRGLPSHGWTRGMFGRRDRCLLVLSQLAGVPYKDLASLTAGNITVTDGSATIRSETRAWNLLPGGDALVCGPCAVTRWLRILDLVVTRPSNRAIAPVLRKAETVTGRSPHLCRSTRPLDEATLEVPLLPPIDQWGYVPFPVQRLTPHSLSRRVRDLLAGDLGAHRDLPADTDDNAPETPVVVPVVERKVYSREDAQRAWARRRADLADLAGVENLLTEIDGRAAELQRRTAAILEEHTEPQ